MTFSYVLNSEQLFRQRIKSVELMSAVNDRYYDRLVKAYDGLLDRKTQLEKAGSDDYLALDHLALLCHILRAQIDSDQQLSV